jgi:hypothetical protein
MPELASSSVLLRRGHPGRGKSKKTVVRSLRLPEAIWRDVEKRAKAKRLNVHQAMRAALLGWLHRAG